jgi:hypothetical protein
MNVRRERLCVAGGRVARGGYGLPKVSSGCAMPDLYMPCGQATHEKILRLFQGWPVCRAGSLQPSSTPFGHPTPYTYGVSGGKCNVGGRKGRLGSRGQFQGVSMDSLQYCQGPLCPTTPCRFQVWPPAGRVGCSRLTTPLNAPCRRPLRRGQLRKAEGDLEEGLFREKM